MKTWRKKTAAVAVAVAASMLAAAVLGEQPRVRHQPLRVARRL